MLQEMMNRRDFLKVSAFTGAWILASDLLSAEKAVAGTVTIPEAEKVTITVIEDNYYDFFAPNSKVVNRYRGNVLAEAGLGFYIETVVDGNSHPFLFDFGRTFYAADRNVDALKIDFNKLEALALTHGHRDHFGALVGLLKSRLGQIPRGIPLYVGEGAFAESGLGKSPNTVKVLHHLKKEDIEALKLVEIVEVKNPTPMVPGAYLTGRIRRMTDYEKGMRGAYVKTQGRFVPDNFLGEQSLVVNLKGKGLVVITGCAHAGVVNTVKHAQEISGIEKVHAIMGGFHLTGAREDLVKRTVADIKALEPDYVVPMHCTGFGATMAFAKEMPDQFVLNTSGTKYIFA